MANSKASRSRNSVVTPGRTCLDEEVEPFGREAAGPAHALERLRAVDRSLAAAPAIEEGDVGLSHGAFRFVGRM